MLKVLSERFKALVMVVMLVLGILGISPAIAQADTTEISIGSQDGSLVFEPSVVSIKPGDTVKWVNNLAANPPCNIVFEQIPATASVINKAAVNDLIDYLSYKSQLNKPQETVTKIFNVFPGEYTYSCSAYREQGMVGKIIVD